jgi:hypothetical protein
MFAHIALAFAEKYLKQIGITDYTIDYKDLVLQPNVSKQLNSSNQYIFIMEADSFVSIKSAKGVYNMSHTNQFIHKRTHTGNITIQNHSPNAVGKVQILECTVNS